MALKFVKIRGGVIPTPVFINALASGTIQRGSIVEFSRSNSRVEPASSNTTTTNIFGIALDYIEGASDTYTRVVPFAQGQIWEIDCTNAVTTAQLFLKHALTDSLTLNNSSTDVKTAKGIFVAYNVVQGSIGITLLRGEFIRAPVGWGGTDTSGYF